YEDAGGQRSTSTPRAAVAKFAMGGKGMPKKDLGLIAMSYGYVYVARIAMGANDQQTLRAILEAESYDGPSLIIAYSHCIAHGYDMAKGLEQQKLAVQSGHWPMYRYDPRLSEQGQNPLIIESKEPSIPISQYAYNETRYKMLTQLDEARAEELMQEAQHDAKSRWTLYQQMAAMHYGNGNGNGNKEKDMTDFFTTYLGLRLRNPIVASASPLSKKIDRAKKLDEAGIGAIVMFSLFEEQIIQESLELDHYLNRGTDTYPEALSYLPDGGMYGVSPEKYLNQVGGLKKAVSVPVIGSLNGVSKGAWTNYARKIEEAGADALELNLYFIPTDLEMTSNDIEDMQVELVAD